MAAVATLPYLPSLPYLPTRRSSMAVSSALSHTNSPFASVEYLPAYGSARRGSTNTITSSSMAHNSSRRAQSPATMTSSSTVPTAKHAKLHKRHGSVTSLSGSQPFPINIPSPIQDEYTLGACISPQKSDPVKKIKPYLRKMSLRDSDEEQGRLDLSRPSADPDNFSSMSVRDISGGARSASEVPFARTARRQSHTRATSNASQTSTTQPFVHPMRQVPRPYTPPTALSHTTTPPSEEVEEEESADVLSNELYQADFEPLRFRRSASVSSVPHALSMQLSQNFSNNSFTRLNTASQSNLSLMSSKSEKVVEKTGRTRRDTVKSYEIPATPSSRTSIDKAFSILSRPSEPEDAASRAAAIRAARKAFDDKEAAKDLKVQQEEMKRRNSEFTKRMRKEEKQARKSEASDRSRQRGTTAGSIKAVSLNEKVGGMEYTQYAPVHEFSMPIYGKEHVGAEPDMRPSAEVSKTKVARGGWNRFMAWSRTRLLSCV